LLATVTLGIDCDVVVVVVVLLLICCRCCLLVVILCFRIVWLTIRGIGRFNLDELHVEDGIFMASNTANSCRLWNVSVQPAVVGPGPFRFSLQFSFITFFLFICSFIPRFTHSQAAIASISATG
jgi:hypothetical protein